MDSEGFDAIQTLAACADPLEGFEQLDKRWPGRGWDVEALRLKQLRATIAAAQPIRYQPAMSKREPVIRHEREFKDVHEKAEFYQDLFSKAKQP